MFDWMFWAALFVCGVIAALAYALSARRLDKQNIMMHSMTEPFLGVTRELVRSVVPDETGYMMEHFIYDEHKRNGWRPFAWSAIGGQETIQIVDKEDVKYVVKNNFSIPPHVVDMLEDLLGRGSVGLAEGEEWREKRQVFTHLFTRRIQRGRMSEVFGKKAQTLTNLLLQKCADGQPTDLQHLFQCYTFDTTNSTAFSRDMQSLQGNKEHTAFKNTISRANMQLRRRILSGSSLWKVDRALQLSAGEKDLTLALKEMDTFLDEVIAVYLDKDGKVNEAAMRDGTMSGIFFENTCIEDLPDAHEALREFIITVLIGGTDTTSSGLTSTLEELCRHPEWQQRLHEEALQVFGEDTSQPLSFDDIEGRCPVADAVFRESMRLHPPLPISIKEAPHDAVLPSGVHVKAGQQVMWSQYAMHRNRAVWGEDAEEFNPERWMSGKQYDKYEYHIFNAGPRACPGNPMAWFQGKLTLLTLFAHCNFRLAEGATVKDAMGLSRALAAPGLMCHVEPVSTVEG